jgi:NTE family protein
MRWRKPRVGLALSGGGARGLAHVGVLQVLEELNITPVAITGTSAGSIIGALRAGGLSHARIRAAAVTAQWTKLVRPVLPGNSGLLSLAPIDALLEELLAPKKTFAELSIPYACIATDIERDEMVILREGPIAPAVRASCTVPGVFTPVEIGNRLLVDGGVTNNLPVELLFEMGADYAIAVDLLPPRTVAMRPRSMIELMTVTFYNMVRSASREGALAHVLIVPEIRELGFMDFSQREVLFERGRNAAMAHAPKLSRDLGLGGRRVPDWWLALTARLQWVTRRWELWWAQRHVLALPARARDEREPATRR